MDNKNKAKGIFLSLLGAIMWGIMGIFVRNLAIFGYSSTDISFIRCFFAGIIFTIIKLITNPKSLKMSAKGILISFVYGIVACAATFTFYSVSVNRIPVAVATVLMFMSPIWVALISVVVFKEKLKVQTVIIIIICIIGASLVSNIIGVSGGSMDIIGILAGIGNGFGLALQITIPRYFAEKYNYERDAMLAYGFLGAAVSLIFFTNFDVVIGSFLIGNTSTLIINIIGLGIFCTMVANFSFIKATTYIHPTLCAILSAIEVVVGMLVGYLLYRENLTWLQILGSIIVVFGSLGPTILSMLKTSRAVSKNN